MTDPKLAVRAALMAEHDRQISEEPPCDQCGLPRSNVTLAGAPSRTQASGRVSAPLRPPAGELCRCPRRR
jgi:hypothetical protein